MIKNTLRFPGALLFTVNRSQEQQPVLILNQSKEYQQIPHTTQPHYTGHTVKKERIDFRHTLA